MIAGWPIECTASSVLSLKLAELTECTEPIRCCRDLLYELAADGDWSREDLSSSVRVRGLDACSRMDPGWVRSLLEPARNRLDLDWDDGPFPLGGELGVRSGTKRSWKSFVLTGCPSGMDSGNDSGVTVRIVLAMAALAW